MKKGIFWTIVLLLTVFPTLTAQTTAPNEGQTYYYQQTGVVRNNALTAGDNTGQFITFTRRGCYDSDKNGIQAGDGFLAYKGIGNEAHVYEGDTYWGKAFYYFVKDFSKYNVRTADGLIYVYERTTAPATAITSAKVYRKPAPEPSGYDVVIVPPVIGGNDQVRPVVPDNTQWQAPPPDHTAELQRLQARYTQLKANKAREEQRLRDTYTPVIDAGIAKGYLDDRNSIRQTIRLYERQMADIQNEARRLGGNVY